MDSLSEHTLRLFLTRGNSLDTWRTTGTLARELRLYRELLAHLKGVDIVSYGKEDSPGPELRGFGIRDNSLNLHPRLYTPLLANILPRFWPKPAIFKSNQVIGAEVALAAARAAGAVMVARAGYLPGNIAAWAHGADSPQAHEMRDLERRVFDGADMVALTTLGMAGQVREDYGVPSAKIRVVPNFVDTEAFKPNPAAAKRDFLCFVGRLHPEKNLLALLQALAGMDIELVLIGEGHQRPELEARARELGVRARFLGQVPNQNIAGYINQSQAFVFPSTGEHHPKSLIEAMSCGAACLGCDVPGVRDLLSHGETGYVCGTSAGELREALTELLGDPALREKLGQGARRYCQENFALPRVLEKELAMLKEAVS